MWICAVNRADFADFENSADHGSGVSFEVVSGLCLCYVRTLGPKRNLDQKSFFSLASKLFLFSKEVHFNSGVRLLLELYSAVVIKHAAFFTILAFMVFTCSSLPLNLYTSIFGCGCGFGFEQKFWRMDGFGGKKARIGGFAYPYSPLSFILRD